VVVVFCAVPLLEEREIKVGGLNPVVETLFFYSQLSLSEEGNKSWLFKPGG